MFSTLLPVILLSLTSCSFARRWNCSETYTVHEKNYQQYNIKESKKVVCFKAESGRVQLRFEFNFMCDYYWGKAHDCNYYDSPTFNVYDGCNVTKKEVVKKVHCKCCKFHDFCNSEIRWTSEKTSCLKVVLSRKKGRRIPYLSYGMANVHDKDSWMIPCRRNPYRPYRPNPGNNKRRRRRPPPRTRTPPRPRPPVRKEEYEYTELRGRIQSPNYPGNYPPNLIYTYKIELPENKRIQLIFRNVDLERPEKDGECRKDYIKVYDRLNASSLTVMRTICGNQSINKPIISQSNKMEIKFVADRVNGKNKGFNATYDPYQPPTVTNVPQKVTGVVIGTACGLVFLALTFLAIQHFRRLTLLRRHDVQSIYGPDAIEEKAPPSYDDVMASPGKNPLTPSSSEHKEHRFAEIPENEEPPPYPGLVPHAEPGHEVQRSDVASQMSRDVEGVELTREIEANDVTESQDRDVKGVDVRRGSDVRKGSDVRRGSGVEPERDVGEGDGVRKGSDVKIVKGEFNVDACEIKKDGSETVAYQEYSQAITTMCRH